MANRKTRLIQSVRHVMRICRSRNNTTDNTGPQSESLGNAALGTFRRKKIRIKPKQKSKTTIKFELKKLGNKECIKKLFNVYKNEYKTKFFYCNSLLIF